MAVGTSPRRAPLAAHGGLRPKMRGSRIGDPCWTFRLSSRCKIFELGFVFLKGMFELRTK